MRHHVRMPAAQDQPSSAGPDALWRRIADDLVAAIRSGEYPVGAALPSTADLMSTYECSSSPVKAAISALRDAGIAEGRVGARVRVLKVPDAQWTPPSRTIHELLADLTARVERLERDQHRHDD